MQKQMVEISARNEYSYSNLIKAGTVFLSSIASFSFFSLWRGAMGSTMSAQTQQSTAIIRFIEGGRLPLIGIPTDIEVQGNFVFIATLDTGLYIINVNNISSPLLVGHYETFRGVNNTVYPIRDITLVNNLIYLAEDIAGLRILNASNRSAPVAIGIYHTGWSVTQVKVINDSAWLTDNSKNLDIIDITEPTTILRSGVDTIGYAQDIFVSGSLAFIADHSNGLQIIDVTSITNPIPISSFDTPFFAVSVGVMSGMAFVADRMGGLQIIDVGDPLRPSLKGNFTPAGIDAYGITATNQFIYLTTKTGLLILDTNFTNPTLLGNYSTPGVLYNVEIDLSIAYLAIGTYGLQIVDVSSPSNPVLLGVYDTQGYYAYDVVVTYPFAYIADGSNGLLILNVSIPANPTYIGNYDTPATANRVAIAGNIVYVADGAMGLLAIDVTNPANSFLQTGYNTPGDARSVAISGRYAFIADNDAGIQIIDTTQSSKSRWDQLDYKPNFQINDMIVQNSILVTLHNNFGMTLLNSSQLILSKCDLASTGNTFFSMALLDTRVYLGSKNLDIIDVSFPEKPVFLGSYKLNSTVRGIAVSNQLVYAATDVSGLKIIDVSDPLNPLLLSTYATPGVARAVVISGTIAYVADDTSGFHIINVSIATNPTLIGTYNTPGNAYGICVLGAIAFIADGASGLQIFNVSTSSNPVLIGNYDTPGYAYGVTLDGELLYVADGGSGLQIFDIRNPATPVLRGAYDTSGIANDVFISNKLAYIADGVSGLQVLDISNPASPRFLVRYGTPGNVYEVNIYNRFAYFVDAYAGLYISKIPLWDNQLLLSTSPQQLAIKNNLSYVVNTAGFLQIFATQDFTNLTLVSTPYQLAGFSKRLSLQDDFLYVAEGTQGIEIIDIYNISKPQLALQLTETSSSQALALNEDNLFVADALQGLIIYQIQGFPLLVNHEFVLDEKVISATITSNELLARDTNVNANPQDLEFIVTNIQHGQFELISQSGTPVFNFSQQAVMDGLIQFIHDASGILPTFQMSVSNGVNISLPVNITVIYSDINLPPQISNNYLQINEGESMTLTSSELSATDRETPQEQLRFFINNIKNGRFESLNNSGVFITNFIQQEITDNVIQFVHTGGGFDKPSYEVTVSDGELTSLASLATIDFNASPKLITNQLTIKIGEKITLSNNELHAIDIDDDNATLLFIISNVTHGDLNQFNFTQQVLINGQIHFTHDGSEQPSTYLVSVADKRMQTLPAKVISSLIENVADNTSVILGSSVGGAVLLASAVGMGFWYRRRVIDAYTRKQFAFADYVREAIKLKDLNNFDSDKGQRYITAIQKLENEFLTQGGMKLNEMGDDELKSLAKQVATSARNKITANTTLFGYSIIRPEDMDNRKISEIVQEVLRMRVGLDDTSIPMQIFK